MRDGDLVIVRTRDAGVIVGYLEGVDRSGGDLARVQLAQSMRLWRWRTDQLPEDQRRYDLTSIAELGLPAEASVRLTVPLSGQRDVFGVCEILPVSARARESLSTPRWDP